MKSRLFEFGDIISNGKKNFRSTVGLKFQKHKNYKWLSRKENY